MESGCPWDPIQTATVAAGNGSLVGLYKSVDP
jgi:hypothetical protein